MIQPFIESVVTEGEYSLLYFWGDYSHGLLKTPKTGDFRVQEEHGGSLRSIDPSQQMLSISDSIISKLPNKPLYARIDLVKQGNTLLLMELELIEPSLYFNMEEKSIQRFTRSFLKWYEATK